MVGTSLADGNLSEEEIGMVNYLIDRDRDYLESDHPAYSISSNIEKKSYVK